MGKGRIDTIILAAMNESRQRIDDPAKLKADIRAWALELGFQQLGVSDVDLAGAESRLREWLDAGYHGRMDYMSRHGTKRSRPQELVPGTLRIITVRMDYLPQSQAEATELLLSLIHI